MSRLIWSPAALLDVQRLYRFLAPKNMDAAKRAVMAMRQGVRVLGQGKKSETAVKLTDPAKWHMIIEEHGGQTFKTAPGDRPVMYKSAE